MSNTQASSQSANQVAALVNERTNDANQISQIQSQAQQAQVSERAAANGSQVLDPAVAVQVSAKKVTAMDALTGLIAGLGIGIGIVIVGAIISDRPRRRSEVAAALGAPVDLSVGRYVPPLVFRQFRLRRSLKRPGVTMQMVARRLGARLDAEPSSTLAAVAVGPTGATAIGVATLALWLASEGKRVVLVDTADGRPLAALFKAKGVPGSPQPIIFDGLLLTLIVAPEDPSAMIGEVFEDDDAVLVLASVTPSIGADHIATWAKSAVVFVTAGQVTGTLMLSTSQIPAKQGLRPSQPSWSAPAERTRPPALSRLNRRPPRAIRQKHPRPGTSSGAPGPETCLRNGNGEVGPQSDLCGARASPRSRTALSR